MLRENSSVNGCVNDMSEHNTSRIKGLKEIRWIRIKRTSSMMSLEASAPQRVKRRM